MNEAIGERFSEALVGATRLHASQWRKGTQIPYVFPLLGVAAAFQAATRCASLARRRDPSLGAAVRGARPKGVWPALAWPSARSRRQAAKRVGSKTKPHAAPQKPQGKVAAVSQHPLQPLL